MPRTAFTVLNIDVQNGSSFATCSPTSTFYANVRRELTRTRVYNENEALFTRGFFGFSIFQVCCFGPTPTSAVLCATGCLLLAPLVGKTYHV